MEKNTSDYFGAILERVRKSENRSLKDLAELLGRDENDKYIVSPSYLNRLEKGEKENPSFKMVCHMIIRLGLNPVEVFKSFGYENILNHSNKLKSNDIKDIIRTSDILAPIEVEGELKEYLNQMEKECLMRVIDDVLDYSVSDDETYYINQVIGAIYYFKHVREMYHDREIVINDEVYSLIFSKKVKREIDDIGINDDTIYNLVSKLGTKLLEKEKKFSIVDNEIGIIIVLEKIEKNIYIKNIIKDIEQ